MAVVDLTASTALAAKGRPTPRLRLESDPSRVWRRSRNGDDLERYVLNRIGWLIVGGPLFLSSAFGP